VGIAFTDGDIATGAAGSSSRDGVSWVGDGDGCRRGAGSSAGGSACSTGAGLSSPEGLSSLEDFGSSFGAVSG
jgi:hypothetical protein